MLKVISVFYIFVFSLYLFVNLKTKTSATNIKLNIFKFLTLSNPLLAFMIILFRLVCNFFILILSDANLKLNIYKKNNDHI